MKNNAFKDVISEVLGTETPSPMYDVSEAHLVPLNTISKALAVAESPVVEQELLEDYTYARANIRKMLQKGMETTDTLFNLANISQDAKMYDAAAKYMKMIADMNKDLMGASLEMEKIKNARREPEKKTEVTNQQNNFFCGTMSDILEQMKEHNTIVLRGEGGATQHGGEG